MEHSATLSLRPKGKAAQGLGAKSSSSPIGQTRTDTPWRSPGHRLDVWGYLDDLIITIPYTFSSVPGTGYEKGRIFMVNWNRETQLPVARQYTASDGNIGWEVVMDDIRDIPESQLKELDIPAEGVFEVAATHRDIDTTPPSKVVARMRMKEEDMFCKDLDEVIRKYMVDEVHSPVWRRRDAVESRPAEGLSALAQLQQYCHYPQCGSDDVKNGYCQACHSPVMPPWYSDSVMGGRQSQAQYKAFQRHLTSEKSHIICADPKCRSTDIDEDGVCHHCGSVVNLDNAKTDLTIGWRRSRNKAFKRPSTPEKSQMICPNPPCLSFNVDIEDEDGICTECGTVAELKNPLRNEAVEYRSTPRERQRLCLGEDCGSVYSKEGICIDCGLLIDGHSAIAQISGMKRRREDRGDSDAEDSDNEEVSFGGADYDHGRDSSILSKPRSMKNPYGYDVPTGKRRPAKKPALARGLTLSGTSPTSQPDSMFHELSVRLKNSGPGS